MLVGVENATQQCLRRRVCLRECHRLLARHRRQDDAPLIQGALHITEADYAVQIEPLADERRPGGMALFPELVFLLLGYLSDDFRIDEVGNHHVPRGPHALDFAPQASERKPHLLEAADLILPIRALAELPQLVRQRVALAGGDLPQRLAQLRLLHSHVLRRVVVQLEGHAPIWVDLERLDLGPGRSCRQLIKLRLDTRDEPRALPYRIVVLLRRLLVEQDSADAHVGDGLPLRGRLHVFVEQVLDLVDGPNVPLAEIRILIRESHRADPHVDIDLPIMVAALELEWGPLGSSDVQDLVWVC
mmetsp:Transcript_93733/g.302842  ORF Transcript_93733/g.302842 Transcript_93733/m.302842 type:complete len:302 (-) Transcript_93733:933-1838(-)